MLQICLREELEILVGPFQKICKIYSNTPHIYSPVIKIQPRDII